MWIQCNPNRVSRGNLKLNSMYAKELRIVKTKKKAGRPTLPYVIALGQENRTEIDPHMVVN